MSDISICDCPALDRMNVHMKDAERVSELIWNIRNDGAAKLQIISDFDCTLTKQHVEGKEVISSFEIFYKCKQVPAEVREEAIQLHHKYQRIELDPRIEEKARVEAMETWMIEIQALLDFEFDVSELDSSVETHSTGLRTGTKELFEKLKALHVPVLVFSAGLGDVIERVLKREEALLENVKIVSNFLQFRGTKVDGFRNEPVINVCNKNESAVHGEYRKTLEGRNNVILMGDLVADVSMLRGVEKPDHVLKIGFLYSKEDERLPLFIDAYDIVLVDEQTMDAVNEIINGVK